jgi:hypothetical protein
VGQQSAAGRRHLRTRREGVYLALGREDGWGSERVDREVVAPQFSSERPAVWGRNERGRRGEGEQRLACSQHAAWLGGVVRHRSTAGWAAR